MRSDLFIRLRAILRRPKVEQELDEELQFHLQHEIAKRMARGLTLEDATREAKLAFGGVDQAKEACREARGIAFVETTWQDIRYALRGMRRSPSFTIAALITLGLGTAAVATIFTLANTLLFRRLPVRAADRVVIVQATRRHGQVPGWVSYPDYIHFRNGTKTLAGLAAHCSTAPLFVNLDGQAREINGAVVSANYFSLLEVQPALGRFFRQDEDEVPNRDAVAIISYRFWRDWLSGSPDSLGRIIHINGTAFTVIGVAEPDFLGVGVQPTEIYIPTMMANAGYHWCVDALASNCTVLSMIGRLRDEYTIRQARAEIETLRPAAWLKAPEGENENVKAVEARGAIDPDVTWNSQVRFLVLLACIAGVLLLVCCVNLSGLSIARNSARMREFAIRASLGAGRARLIRQSLTESTLLALLGGLLGLAISLALTSGLNAAFYSIDVEGHPLYYNFHPEFQVALAVLTLSILAGFGMGILPALQSTDTDSAENLKRQSSRATSVSRTGKWLAGAQAGIALSLAGTAGLLISSAHLMLAGNRFEPSHVALMRLRPRMVNYSPRKAQTYLRTALARLRNVPGVVAVGPAVPGNVLSGWAAMIALPGWPDAQAMESQYLEVGPQYFNALRIPLLTGRVFDEHDTVGSSPVAIVSTVLARRLWPDGGAVGRAIVIDRHVHQVVGVVEDIGLQRRGDPPEPLVYVPFWQNPDQLDARICIRVRGDPAKMLPMLTREVTRVDPAVPVAETMPLLVQIAGSIRTLRVTASLASYAAGLAILLTAVGLYGTMAFLVARRTKEIGVRLALGAKKSSVLRMVLQDGTRVLVFGLGSGVVLAAAGKSLVRHLLYGSGEGDWRVYASAAGLVAIFGLAACWIPAQRAASVEPLDALREE